MFAKEIYERRRKTLLGKMAAEGCKGIILFIGNALKIGNSKDDIYICGVIVDFC